MAAVTKTDNKKKTLIAVGLGAAGLGALYLLSRGGETQTGEMQSFGGGFSSEGGIVEPTASLATQPTRGTDINALLEGINNLNNQQAERQAALMNDYYNQMTAQQVQAQAAGSANDELADRVSNPVGSATKISDLQKALQGYDISDESYRQYMQASYGVNPDASPGAIYQQLTGGGFGVASFTGEAMGSNALQPTGREATITKQATGNIAVRKSDTGETGIYSPTGKEIDVLTPTASPGVYTSKTGGAVSGTTTAKTQSGGTAQVSHSAPASSTATTAPATSTPASAINSIVSNVASGISSAVSSISSFFGGLFK